MADDSQPSVETEETDDELDVEEPEAEPDEPDDTEGAETEDEEPDGEAGEDEDEPERPRERQRGRPDAAQRNARRTRESRLQDRIDRLERQLGTPARNQTDFAEQRRQLDQRRSQELEAARLDGPERYADVRDRHLREDFQADSQRRDFAAAESVDQARFDRLRDRDPTVDRVADEVERRVQQLRANGTLPSSGQRETIANIILGERMRARVARAGTKQRRVAAETRERQTVRRPPNPASTVRQGRQPRSINEATVEEIEAQLGNIPMARFK